MSKNRNYLILCSIDYKDKYHVNESDENSFAQFKTQ
jgi:hypothetical protein